MASAPAYLLVFHGSRDPRPWQAVQQLSELVLSRLRSPSPLVGIACLELGPLPFHQQIQQFAEQAIAQGFTEVQILPLFLLPGVHVKEDIPGEVAIAQSQLPTLPLHLRPHLGSHPHLIHLLPPTDPNEAVVLLSHGSRRSQGNEPVEAIAQQLGALPAYWSVAPTLEAQIQQLVAAGYGQIKIIPYFLFAGGITDAIALQVAQLAQQFLGITLQLTDPLGPSPALVDCILDLTATPTPIPFSVT